MIWLIGNKGMLGTELSLLLEKSGITFVGTDCEVDIGDPAALKHFVEKQTADKQSSSLSSHDRLKFDWIINCAAYTAVDKAEDDADNCRRLNTLGADNIAVCAKNIGAKLIHISTDYVFDGTGNTPYTEEDATAPIGVYGLTKREGECVVLENNPRSYIIRTAWLYGKYGNNFVRTILRLMNERSEINVVNDQRGSPTWTFDLAVAIAAIINAGDTGHDIPFGIYHYTNEGDISWFDFAREIYRQGRAQGRVRRECLVSPCTSVEYPAKVKRPAYSVLDKSKIKATLRLEIPVWDKSLKEFLQTCEN